MLLDHSFYGRVNNKEQPWVPDLHRKTNDGTLELYRPGAGHYPHTAPASGV
jgi:hypothetical protein